MPQLSFSTHVLDAARGCPAAGVPLALRRAGPDEALLAAGVADGDGRFRYPDDQGFDPLPAGVYRIVFDTAAYYVASDQSGFYPEVSVTFRITDPAAHHHVPLLLSPFAYSTYRGS
ncbi:MAG: hydroxyisourate hydrolase [Nakamurella sp.]